MRIRLIRDTIIAVIIIFLRLFACTIIRKYRLHFLMGKVD